MKPLSRRDVLGTSAGVLVGAALEAALAGCRSDPPAGGASEPLPPAEPSPVPNGSGRFSAEQRAIVEDITDYLIPETSTPGARRAGVPAYIESVVFAVDEESDRQAFCDGLDAFDARARQSQGQPFTRCAPEARLELVRALFANTATNPSAEAADAVATSPAHADGAKPFRQRVRELTIQGFCKSRFGATRVLQYDPVPGAYDGCRSLESVGRAWATS